MSARNKPHPNCQECTLSDCFLVPSEVPRNFDKNKKTIWIVGEAPGAQEVEKGYPFAGKSGALLRDTLRWSQLRRFANIVITNSCLCRPPDNRTPKADEIKACSWHFKILAEKFPPDLILAVGKSATVALGLKVSITKQRGQTFDSEYGKVLVTYHPAAILRQGTSDRLLSQFRQDFLKAANLLNVSTEEPDFEVIVPTSNSEAKELFEELKKAAIEEQKFVAFDIETLPIPWDSEEYGKELKEVGTDPHNPFSGVFTISFAFTFNGKTKAFAVPVRWGEGLEKLLTEQKHLYKETFTDTPTVSGFKKFKSLVSKLVEDKPFSERSYSEVASFWKPFADHLNNPSIEKLRKAALEVYKKPLFSPAVLERAKEELKKVPDVGVTEEVLDVISNGRIRKIAHNAKFEIKFFLHEFGLEVKGMSVDTMLLAYLMNEGMQGFYGLDSLTANFLPEFEGYKEKYLSEDLLTYNAMDSLVTLRLAKKLFEELYNVRPKWEAAKVTGALKFLTEEASPLLAKIELRGFVPDMEKLKSFERKTEELEEELLDRVEKITGTREITKASFKNTFYSLYEYEPVLTEKGALSLSSGAISEVMSKTSNGKLKELCALLLTLSKLSKYKTAYFKAYRKLLNPFSGRIHPSFHLTGTETGRLSSSKPNFQQIPRDPIKVCSNCKVIPTGDSCPICETKEFEKLMHFKELISVPKGYKLIAADYSQMEVRILAEFTKDKYLLKALNEGLDMHSYSASKIFGIPYEEIRAKKNTDEYIASLRQKAKDVTFGVMYGQSAAGLANRHGISIEEAEKIVTGFFREFPSVEAWIREIHTHVKQLRAYYTPIGRIRRFQILSKESFRQAQNFPIQSFASDIALAAAVELQRRLEPLGGHVIGLVHDSIEAEVPEDKVEEAVKVFKEAMVDYVKEKFNLSVPIKVDIEVGDNWGEMVEI